jgi:hypothetical protein
MKAGGKQKYATTAARPINSKRPKPTEKPTIKKIIPVAFQHLLMAVQTRDRLWREVVGRVNKQNRFTCRDTVFVVVMI